MKRLDQSGFTLVEIMIVVAIIALLAAIAIPSVLRGRASANEAAAIGNTRALMNGLEMFHATNNEYPDAWQADMYTDANPDFGPPAFDLDITDETPGAAQGYDYLYTQDTATSYHVDAYPSATTNGTRSFFVNETGILRHCRCPADGCASDTHADSGDVTLEAAPAECG